MSVGILYVYVSIIIQLFKKKKTFICQKLLQSSFLIEFEFVFECKNS